jgi:hypothetical protein
MADMSSEGNGAEAPQCRGRPEHQGARCRGVILRSTPVRLSAAGAQRSRKDDDVLHYRRSPASRCGSCSIKCC